jgi:hypothetical protein
VNAAKAGNAVNAAKAGNAVNAANRSNSQEILSTQCNGKAKREEV